MPEVLSGTLGASRARVRARLWRVLVGLSLAVCSVAESEQMVAHFNGDGHAARVDVNGFSRSPDRLAASDTNMRLGPPGSGFPGDGTDGRALDAGVSGTHPQHLHVPVDGEADFSQGTFEAWVKTTWDWTDPERHSFIELRMAGEKRNGLNLCYDGRAPKRGLCFKMNDGDGTGDHCTSYDVAGLEWRKGEWHHIAASWTPRSSWLFADGKLVARAMHSEVMVFSPAAGPLRVGEPDWLFATPCAALIDEVRVCDVPLHVGRDSILPWAPALLDGAEVTASSTSEPVVSVEDVPKLHDGLYGKGALLGRTQTTGYVLVAWDEPKRVSGVRWSRDGRPLIDRGAKDEVGWAWITDMPADYVVEASIDGKAWTEVLSRTDFFVGPPQLSERGARMLDTFEPVTARHVRMRVTRVFPYGAGAGPILDEIEVLEADTGRDLARDATVSTERSAQRYRYSPGQIIDGRVGESNAWRAADPGPATITLVLGEETEVRELEWSRSAEGLRTDGTPRELIVEGHVGGAWVELATVHNNSRADRQRVQLRPTVTRQVRLRILSTADGKEATLDEVALY